MESTPDDAGHSEFKRDVRAELELLQVESREPLRILEGRIAEAEAITAKSAAWMRALVLAVLFVAGVLSLRAAQACFNGELVFPLVVAMLAGVLLAMAWRWTR